MLKFNQYLAESLGVLKAYPDYLAKHIAKNFRVGHDAIIKKFDNTHKLADFEMNDGFMEAVMDFGSNIPVIIELGNDEYAVFSIDPVWDEEQDHERAAFFEGNCGVFYKGKLVKQGYGLVEYMYPHAKGAIIYPTAKRMARMATRWERRSGIRKGYPMKQAPFTPFQLLFDQRVDELNKVAGTPLLKKIEAHQGQTISYGWIAPDRFSKALKKAIGHLPSDYTNHTSLVFISFSNAHVTDFSKIRYEIDRINRVIEAVKKYGPDNKA